MNELKIQAKNLVMDCLEIYFEILTKLKNHENLTENLKFLLNELNKKDFLFDLIQNIVVPDNEKDLENFLRITERRKIILSRCLLDEFNAGYALDMLLGFENYFSDDLIAYGFMIDEFAKYLKRFSLEDWEEIEKEVR